MTSHAAAAEARCFALVPAAGRGERAGAGQPKQYAQVAGRSVIAHTLAALSQVPRLAQVLVVLAADDRDFMDAVPGFEGICQQVGGRTRAASVRAGLDGLRQHGAHHDDWVLVHDAARCLVTPASIERLIQICVADEVGGLLALPLADTLKDANLEGVDGARVRSTLDRRGKWLAQTPQMFRLGILADALDRAGSAVTDEASAIEALGLQPRLVMGEADNFKVTWPEDFARAERVLAARASSGDGLALRAARIAVSDMVRARRFYRDDLGLVLKAEGPAHLVFEAGPVDLVIEPAEPDEGFMPGRFTGLSFAVSDAWAHHEALRRRGVRFIGAPEPQAWGGILATLADPDGNQLQLVQYPHRTPKGTP